MARPSSAWSRAVVIWSSFGQAGGVHVGGVAHAERMRLLRHQPGERVFVAAEIFGDRDGCVVSGPRDHRLDRVFDDDRLAGLEPELGGRLGGSVLGNVELGVEPDLAGLEPLEQ